MHVSRAVCLFDGVCWKHGALTLNSQSERRSPLKFILLALVTVAALAGLLAALDVKDRFIVKRWGVVEPGRLYRSGQISRWLIEDQLRETGIETIVDLNGLDPNDPHQEEEIASAERLDIPIHRFQLRGDGTGEVTRYANALAQIHQALSDERTVLVHCHAGTYRTGGTIFLYRVLVQGKPVAEAKRELQDYGWSLEDGRPLAEYLRDHVDEIAELLVERGVISEVPQPAPDLAPLFEP